MTDICFMCRTREGKGHYKRMKKDGKGKAVKTQIFVSRESLCDPCLKNYEARGFTMEKVV